jgi:hypothetical protein
MEIGQGPNWGCSAKENNFHEREGISEVLGTFTEYNFGRTQC